MPFKLFHQLELWLAQWSLELWLKQRSGVTRFCIVMVLTLLVAWLDLATPPYINVTGYYLLPIFLAVWFCRPVQATVVVVICDVINVYTNHLAFPADVAEAHEALSDISVLVVFVTFAALFYFLKGTVDRLRDESRTDLLTGLNNRRSFLEVLEMENLRMKRFGQALTLVAIDVDNFKSINDTQGHQRGDALLVALGDCLKRTMRDVDCVARLGGDEFSIVLPRTSLEEAERVLGRLQGALRTVVKSFSDQVSASIGAVVVSDKLQLSVSELLEKADSVMYSVKHKTKDDLVIMSLA